MTLRQYLRTPEGQEWIDDATTDCLCLAGLDDMLEEFGTTRWDFSREVDAALQDGF